MPKNMVFLFLVFFMLLGVGFLFFRYASFRASQHPVVSGLFFYKPDDVFRDITNPLQWEIYDRDFYKDKLAKKIDKEVAQSLLKEGKAIFMLIGSSDIPGIPSTQLKLRSIASGASTVYQMINRQPTGEYRIESVSYVYENKGNMNDNEEGIMTLLISVPLPDDGKDHIKQPVKLERIYLGTMQKDQWNELSEIFEGAVPYAMNDNLDR